MPKLLTFYIQGGAENTGVSAICVLSGGERRIVGTYTEVELSQGSGTEYQNWVAACKTKCGELQDKE